MTGLNLALRGNALEIIQTISEDKRLYNCGSISKSKIWQLVPEQVYTDLLKVGVQGSTESLQEYSANIERIARLASPEIPYVFIHNISVQCIVDGVGDVTCRRR